jgi:chorismate lyase/3-hydroxybenzoate synthase
MLLIGGTASILGEHSRHAGDIEAQMEETCRNIAALIGPASGQPDAGSLDALRSVRVHVRHAHDCANVQSMLSRLAPALAEAEFVQASLCRRELLVEIEGVAGC